jgi:Tat protein translocase TatB subunit
VASSLSLVFGSLGGPEVILLFIAALLLFGPRRLPEIGRTLGKTVADFRRATSEFRMNLEREVRMDELKDTIRPIENAPRPETLARGVLQDVTAPATAASSEPEDGGPSSVH